MYRKLENTLLFLSDSDGTICNPFELSPKGIGIEKAYKLAVKDIFGQQGLNIYNKNGGLNNRSPTQVITSLIELGGKKLLDKSYKSLMDYPNHLDGLIPIGKGVPLEWKSDDPVPVLTELMVRYKLSYFINEIGSILPDGSIWPKLYPGFSLFFNNLKNNKNSEFGIISSGHEIFIKKVFEVHKLEPPKIIITDDDTRGLTHLPAPQRSKPSKILISMAIDQFMQQNQISKIDTHFFKNHTVYTGDDIYKDGMLAINYGIQFLLFDPLKKTKQEELSIGMSSFSSWILMNKLFTKYGSKFFLDS